MKTRVFAGTAVMFAIAIALEFSIVPTAFAQPPGRDQGGAGREQSGPGRGQGGPGRGQGGQRGGFGGGGMMMRGGGDPVMSLLRSPDVRKEIKVDAEQEAAITKIEEQVREQSRAGGDEDARNFDFRNASEEKRQEFFAKMQASQKEQAAKSRELLDEVLLPAQLQRLDELVLQQRGVVALSDSEVQKSLDLSAEQIGKLDKVRSEQETAMRDKMRELMQSGERDSMREKMTEIRDQIEKSVMDVLTTDQKAKFAEMKGADFDFGDRGAFGGGRGGDRGDRGGARGGDRGGDRGARGGDRGARGGDRGARGGDRGDRGGDRGGADR